MPGPTPGVHLPPAVQPARVLVWALHLALPVAALWLLLAQPQVDAAWQHQPSHFWLVLVVAAINVVVGVRMSATARRHTDARLFLVSLAFLTSAGFFALHALATPGVLIAHPNTGFDVAQPVGLALASVFAVASGLPFSRAGLGPAVRAARRGARAVVAVLLVAWAVVSLVDLPPLNQPPPARDVEGPLAIVAVGRRRALRASRRCGSTCCTAARPAAVLLSLVTAFALLAEAMVAVILADEVAPVVVGVARPAHVRVRLRRLQRLRPVPPGGHQRRALRRDRAGRDQPAHPGRVRRGAGGAGDRAAGARAHRHRGAGDARLAARLAERFGLTERQTAVLDRAGAALATERERTRAAGALVEAGEQARVGARRRRTARRGAAPGPPGVRRHPGRPGLRWTAHSGRSPVRPAARWPGPGPHRHGRAATLYPLYGQGPGRRRARGARARPGTARPTARAGDPLVATLATQLSITLENARLYRELGTLFRQYMSPDVAAALLADPDQAALGGSVVEVTALFADLRGFTTFSEGVEPAEIVRMLNRYHGAAVPCILDNGGTIVQFVGDALLALFNAPARQTDHARRAVRAALAMQRAVEAIAAAEPGWPRLRVGANTGPALVGNIGSETLRGFNAMGDAVNVAARLQRLAEPGQVVIGEATLLSAWQAIGPPSSRWASSPSRAASNPCRRLS